MLTTRYKAGLNRWFEPLAGAIARTGVSPSIITLGGVALSAIVCLIYIQTRATAAFCVAITLTACFDALDGAVARATGRVTKFGSYLDAICDRYVDIMVLLATAYVSGYWALSMVLLAGALLVSYTKARAAMEVPVGNYEWPDLMERTERAIVFLGGLFISALVPIRPWGRDLFWWTLVLLAVLVHLTVIQRMIRAHHLIRSRS